MDANDLKPHDINITQQTNIGNNGQVLVQRRLTFWVGTHGPFTVVYDPDKYSAAQVKLDIQKEIDELASIGQWAK